MGTCTICQETLRENAEYCPCCGANVVCEEASEEQGVGGGASAPVTQPANPAPPVAVPCSAHRTVAMDPDPVVTPPQGNAPQGNAPQGGGAVTASLTVKRGGLLSSDTFAFGGSHPIIIGRFDPETGPVDIDLGPLPEGGYVSRHHANLLCSSSGQWSVHDLKSRNGVFVRRAGQAQFKRVTEAHDIQSGDEIALGNARFEFRV